MTARPRKITPEQLERIRENAKRNWGRAMEKLGPDEPVTIPRRPRRKATRRRSR